jgi:hypothetical protein
MIQVNDYIEGYEYYGRKVKRVSGWVDKIEQYKGEII